MYNIFDDIICAGGSLGIGNNDIEICNIWFNVWDRLKLKITNDIRSIEELDDKYSGEFSISNWCQDFEMELLNSGLKDTNFFAKRIKYCREFTELLPDSNKVIIENMRKAIAESLFYQGKQEEGEKEFELVAKDFPESIWVFICWGDMYNEISNHKIKKNPEKAMNLYKKALTKSTSKKDKAIINDRIASI